MNVQSVVPFLSSAIMLVFAAAVFRRWLGRRHPFLLLWAAGLTMFSMGVLTEAFFTLQTSATVFRLWYLTGAMLNAAWIGQGTVYLLARRPVAHALFAVIVVMSIVGTYGVLTMPLNTDAMTTAAPLSDQYKEVLTSGVWVRAFTPFLNIYGVVTMVGGATYSAFLFWRKRSLPNRMWGNMLIAAGALSVTAGGTLARLGVGELLYFSELVAAALMFSGFLVASQRVPRPELQPVRAASKVS